MSSSGIHRGYLRKYGGFLFKQWKEKFLTLLPDGSLLICPNAGSPAELGISLGTSCDVILEGSEICDLPRLPSGAQRDSCLGLSLSDGRFLLFLAPNTQECRRSPATAPVKRPPFEIQESCCQSEEATLTSVDQWSGPVESHFIQMPATDAGEALGTRSTRPRPHSLENPQQTVESGCESLRQYMGGKVVSFPSPFCRQWLNILRKVKENFSQGSLSSCKAHRINLPPRKCCRKGGVGAGANCRGSPGTERREAAQTSLCQEPCLRHSSLARARVQAACLLVGGAAAGPSMGYMVTSANAGQSAESHPPDFKELGYHPSACDTESQYEALDYEGMDQDFDALEFGAFTF